MRRPSITAVVTAVAILLCLNGCASTISSVTFRSAPLKSHAAFADISASLDALIRSEMKQNRIPGLAIGLVTSDGLTWGAGYGTTGSGTGEQVSVDTSFAVASVTKPLTAAAVMLLVQEGVIELSAPVSRYLPRFSPPVAPAQSAGADAITIRHLLSHHSGLVRDLQKGVTGPSSNEVDLVELASSVLLADKPGEVYRYSNVGYGLLGEMIEAVTGMEYADFMNERIFAPLSMNDTTIHGDHNSPVRRDAAAGSAVSTVRDLASCMAMLLRKGKLPDGKQMLEAELISRMFMPPFELKPLDEDNYALGFKVGKFMTDPPDVRHGGTLDGYSSLIVMVPEESIGVIVLYNADHGFSRHYIANQAVNLLLNRQASPALRYPAANLSREREIELSGHHVGVGDFSLHIELDMARGKLNLSGESLNLAKLRGMDTPAYRVVKRIAGINVPVAGAFGAQSVRFDFAEVERPGGAVTLPRVTMRYRDLPLEICFLPVPVPVRPVPRPRKEITYTLSTESRHFAPEGPEAISIYSRDGLIFADLEDGDIPRMVLEKVEGPFLDAPLRTPLEGEVFQAYGTGMTFRFHEGKLHYSGLVFRPATP